MTFFRGVALVVGLLLVAAIVGVAWYLFGSNGRPAEELVPADTLAFAVIPNGATLGAGYQGSHLKQLVESPQAQPLLDEIEKMLGDKNLALLRVLAPDLSGQSFLAVTHYDPAHAGETGFIAGMRPKLGTDHFDTFLQQVNANYPDLARETKTGRDTLGGLDYQWIQGANSPGRICVARYHGWIITTWGEAALQDWVERMEGKSATPSLAENESFKQSRDRVGASDTLVYVNYQRIIGLWVDHWAVTNPALAESLRQRLGSIGGAAVGTSFHEGDIIDRFSVLEPKQAQFAGGLATTPCAFETLKFTGPNTRLYFGASVNWQQIWKNMQAQIGTVQPAQSMVTQLLDLAQEENIDVQKNIIDALGSEFSLQVEWAPDSLYPDLSMYVKVEKPNDFKPAVTALINATRTHFVTSGVITEMESDGHHFATLKMIQPMPVSPTITEDGPYFGFFLNETHAVRSLQRDESRGLLHNDDFNRETAGHRDGAGELVFLDAPRLLDQGYRTAAPYLSMGAMLNPTLGALLRGWQMPADLTWLAPIGTWGATVKSDDNGFTGYSISGIGNQGFFLAGGLAGTAMLLQHAGILPQHHRFTVAQPGSPSEQTPPGVAVSPSAPVPAAPAPLAPPPPAQPAPPSSTDATPSSSSSGSTH